MEENSHALSFSPGFNRENIHFAQVTSQFNQMSAWNRRLRRSFGMKETFEFKMLRRAAAGRQCCQVSPSPGPRSGSSHLTDPVAEEVRSQVMGYVDSSIYKHSYQNQIVNTDIVSAFLETPSDKVIMKLMGHMSLTRDPNAPAESTSAQRRQVQADLKVVMAERLLDISTKTIRDHYGSVAAVKRNAQENLTIQIKVHENTRLRKDHNSLFKRKLTSLFEVSRDEYFFTPLERRVSTISARVKRSLLVHLYRPSFSANVKPSQNCCSLHQR